MSSDIDISDDNWAEVDDYDEIEEEEKKETNNKFELKEDKKEENLDDNKKKKVIVEPKRDENNSGIKTYEKEIKKNKIKKEKEKHLNETENIADKYTFIYTKEKDDIIDEKKEEKKDFSQLQIQEEINLEISKIDIKI